MNLYKIRDWEDRTHRVQAHSAEDAIACFRNQGKYTSGVRSIRCVEAEAVAQDGKREYRVYVKHNGRSGQCEYNLVDAVSVLDAIYVFKARYPDDEITCVEASP